MNRIRLGTWHARAARPSLLALGLLCAAAPAAAQQYYDPGVFRTTMTSKPQDYAAEGIRLGAFTLLPAVDAAVEWHDNIYYENQNPTRDTVYHLRPTAILSSGWSRHALSVTATGDLARFKARGEEDYDDLVVAVSGRLDVQRGKFFTARAATMALHEDRSSPDDPGGVTPTDFSLNRYNLGYTHNFNRLTAQARYQRDDTDYKNNRDEDGDFIDNGDRDRLGENLTLRLDYLHAPQRALFLSLTANRVRYDLAEDFEGFTRDSDGFSVQAGVRFDITGTLAGDLYAEYLEQDYDDPGFASTDHAGFGMSLSWYPTRLTTVRLRAEHAALETTQPYTSGYVGSIYSARVQHEFRRWLLLHARVSYTDNSYDLTADAPSTLLSGTRVKRADLGMSYLFNRHVSLTAGYAWEEQDANRLVDQYDANRYYLVLGLEL